MTARLPLLLSCMLLAAVTVTVQAQTKKRPPPDAELTIASRTVSDDAFLRGEARQGLDVTLTGELRLPNWDERLPAVILLHGSDGPTSGAVFAWRNRLDKEGFATFRLDSFTGRGIRELETDQTRLGFLNVIFDLYRSVEALSADPRIDRDRIAVMGFSRGGSTAFYAALRRFQKLYGPKSGRIAAYLPFYAGCGLGITEDAEVVDRPIRAFHGALDDWVPASDCQALTDRMQAAGHDVRLRILPDAHHAFDNPQTGAVHKIEQAQTARKCKRREVDHVIINVDTGQPFTYGDACIEKGPTVGYDAAATEAAAAEVMILLKGLGP